MTSTIQKKIKFSKGMVSEGLIERTDLSVLDSSCLDMTNYVATIQGGFRTRRGTKFLTQDLMNMGNTAITPTVVSCLGDSTHLFDDATWTSNTIGTSRTLCEFDCGEDNVSGIYLALKDIHSKGGITIVNTTSGSGSVDLLDGIYEVAIAGGGAGSYANGYHWTTTSHVGSANIHFSHHSCAADTGGSGAGFFGDLRLNGNYAYSVGGAGNGNNNGAASTFSSGNTVLINAGGGNHGSCSVGKTCSAYGGGGGTLTMNITPVSSTVQRNGNNGSASVINNGARTTSSVGAASVLNGQSLNWGASNNVSGGYNSASSVTGVGGGVRIKSKSVVYPIVIQGKNESDEWEEIGRFSSGSENETLRTFFIEGGINKIRIILDVEAELSVYDQVELKNIKLIDAGAVSDFTGIKMEKFYFNDDEKYLLAFLDEQVVIFENDEIKWRISAPGLNWQYLKDLKTTVSEDTMILTHQDMPPKQLQRTLDNNDNITWTWSTFELKNIPYHAFGGTTETTKTTGITPSAVEGAVTLVAASSIFDSSWVGQYIDGGGGRVKITSYTDGTHVSGYTIIPFYTTAQITSWKYIYGYEQVWSNARGWPRTCLFANQRLFFGGSKSRPSTVWGSRVGLYNDFMNAGNFDNDAIDADLTTMSAICNLVYNRGLHIFTTGEEMTISENAMTPDTFSVTLNTQNGSLTHIDPAISSGQVLFIEKNGKSLLSYVYDYNQASYQSDNLTILSNLVSEPVSMDIEINSARDKGDFLFIVLADGTMLVNTLCLPQDVKALSKYITDGEIKDVCCVRDETYLLVKRGNLYFIEKLGENPTDAEQSIFITEEQVSGLRAYANKTVHVWSDTKDYGEYLVDANGTFFMNTVPNEKCRIGIVFGCKLASHYMNVGNQSSSINSRISRAVLSTLNTEQMSLNGVKKHAGINGVFNFFSVTPYSRRTQFVVESRFHKVNCLAITLYINYGRFE